MHVIVTRPVAQASEWVAALALQGIRASALPLIGIGPADDTALVQAAWRSLARRRLVVFVSPNAAEQFFACRPPSADGAEWPAALLAGSPGPGTTQVLRRLGVPGHVIVEPATNAPQFDSESLWASLAGVDWRGASVLIVRGDGGREWLGDTLTRHGATVGTVVAYRRTPPDFNAEARELLAAAAVDPGRYLWFFSSSEAIGNLAGATPPHPGAWSAGRALATHPRIAERARAFGFGTVVEARPTLPAVLACIQSFGT